MDVPKRIHEVKQQLIELVGLGRSFDVIFREFEVGQRKAAFFFYNGFAKDLIMTPILERLSFVQHEQLVPRTIEKLCLHYVPSIQIEYVTEMKLIIEKVGAGASAIFIDRECAALVLDTRLFPARMPEEPSNEKVVRGSRDGFVETLLTNVTLIRRRLRAPQLLFEITKIGNHTQVDVALGYLEHTADPQLVAELKRRLSVVQACDIPMTDKQLEEYLFATSWSLIPNVRYTERPDVVCSHLLEGHVVLLVDTSPSVMILPSTYFHHLQHAEEYRNTPLVGTYLRWVRYLGVFASVLLLPIWLLFAQNPELLPDQLQFIGPRDEGSIPLLLQFLFAEIGIDLMRMAAIHTPTPLATAMGLIAAILIGEIAVKVGLFVPEVILYIAISAVGSFATPSYELSLAHRIVRIGLLLTVALFHLPGLMIGLTVILFFAARRSIFQVPFLWPFLPFDGSAMKKIMFRWPYQKNKQSH